MTREDIDNIISIVCPNDEDFEKPIISPAYLKRELETLALEEEPSGDLISRHSAIFLADDLKQDLPDDERIADMVMAHNEGILEYQTQLSPLPSVKPQEPKYCDRNICIKNEYNGIGCDECEVTKSQKPCDDVVSREAVREILSNAHLGESKLAYELDKLPSVNVQRTSNADKKHVENTLEDAISRQAAIDAFERFIHELGIKDEPYNYGEMALSAKNVPPVTPRHYEDTAQPKTGHWVYEPQKRMISETDEGVEYRTEYRCKCSNCAADYGFTKMKDAYCRYCGVKMVEPGIRNDKR